jgi:hypothetical protein
MSWYEAGDTKLDKSKIRSTKSETNSNPQIQMLKTPNAAHTHMKGRHAAKDAFFGILKIRALSLFRISKFDIRISAFALGSDS